MMTDCLTGNQLLQFLYLLDTSLYEWVSGVAVVIHAYAGDVLWMPLAQDPTIWCIVQ